MSLKGKNVDLPSEDPTINEIAERKNTNLRQLLVDFMSYTTSHGLGRLIASTTGLWKLFWIISFLGASVMFVYQVSMLFQIYLSRPVQTFVTIKFENVRHN